MDFLVQTTPADPAVRLPRHRPSLVGGWQLSPSGVLPSILNQPAGTLSRSCSSPSRCQSPLLCRGITFLFPSTPCSSTCSSSLRSADRVRQQGEWRSHAEAKIVKPLHRRPELNWTPTQFGLLQVPGLEPFGTPPTIPAIQSSPPSLVVSCQFFTARFGYWLVEAAGSWLLAGESGQGARFRESVHAGGPAKLASLVAPSSSSSWTLGPPRWDPSSQAHPLANSRRPGSHTAIAYIPPLPTHPVGSGAPPRPLCHHRPPFCSIAARLRR